MKRKTFLFNLGIIFLICIVLYIVFFISLHSITKHGKEVKIPDVMGKRIDVATWQLKELHFETAVDSIFDPAAKPLIVLRQTPDTGSIVKEGRTVFLTINMVTPPKIPMPKLTGMSLRSAEMLLRNNILLLGDTTYKPDINGGLILEQRYNGFPINPGQMIPQGSKISLVIGNGLGNTQYIMPDLIDMNEDMAMTMLSPYRLRIGIVARSGVQIADTAAAKVIGQEPKAISQIRDMDTVTLTIE
jgi:eukaryotic-like serine/threonine-protein kinase